MLRGLKQTLYTPRPRDPTEIETELCLSVSCAGMAQQWTDPQGSVRYGSAVATGVGALGAADLGMA